MDRLETNSVQSELNSLRAENGRLQAKLAGRRWEVAWPDDRDFPVPQFLLAVLVTAGCAEGAAYVLRGLVPEVRRGMVVLVIAVLCWCVAYVRRRAGA